MYNVGSPASSQSRLAAQPAPRFLMLREDEIRGYAFHALFVLLMKP